MLLPPVYVTLIPGINSINSKSKAQLRTQDQAPRTSPLVIEAAGQRYRHTTQFLYLGGLVDASANNMPEIKRRVQLAWACYHRRFKRELYGPDV